MAFENRRTAGRALAAALGTYSGSQMVVLVACEIHYPTAHDVSDHDIRRLLRQGNATGPEGVAP